MGQVALPVHMIEHSLSALYDVAHGAGLSIVLPGWMCRQVREKAGRFARLAREVFGINTADNDEAARAGINVLRKWFAAIGSPVSLAEVGITAGDIDRIAENAAELAQVWGLKAYSRQEICAVLELCR